MSEVTPQAIDISDLDPRALDPVILMGILRQARQTLHDNNVQMFGVPITDDVLEDFVAVAVQETNSFADPNETGAGTIDLTVKSKEGATGAFQFLPALWGDLTGDVPHWGDTEKFGLMKDPKNRADPYQSAMAALMAYAWNVNRGLNGFNSWQGHPDSLLATGETSSIMDPKWENAKEVARKARVSYDLGLSLGPVNFTGVPSGTKQQGMHDYLNDEEGIAWNLGNENLVDPEKTRIYEVQYPNGMVEGYFAIAVGDNDPSDGGAVIYKLSPGWDSSEAESISSYAWEMLRMENTNWHQGAAVEVELSMLENGSTPDGAGGFINFAEGLHVLEMAIGFAGDEEALKDPYIQGKIAELWANPGAWEAFDKDIFLQDVLINSEWGRSTTEKQIAWGNMNETAQGIAKGDARGQIEQLYRTYVGRPLEANEATFKSIKVGAFTLEEWTEKFASGEISSTDIVTALKSFATTASWDTPWERSVRDMEGQEGAWETTKENKIEEIENLYRQWGLSPESYQPDVTDFANELLSNKISMADVMDSIRETSSSLYPGKPEHVSYADYAMPAVQIWNEEMPTKISYNDTSNSFVMNALKGAQFNADTFRTSIRQTDDWKRSKRAKEVAADKMRTLGNTFGFNRGGGIF